MCFLWINTVIVGIMSTMIGTSYGIISAQIEGMAYILITLLAILSSKLAFQRRQTHWIIIAGVSTIILGFIMLFFSAIFVILAVICVVLLAVSQNQSEMG